MPLDANPVRARLTRSIEEALAKMVPAGRPTAELPRAQLTPPKNPAHGDYACNVAMPLAKLLGKNPRQIANELQAQIGDAGGMLVRSEVAGPGFLNLYVSDAAWRQALADIIDAGEGHIRSRVGAGTRVLVEFVSANPTGPLHVAHGRGAVTGDVVARLLDAAGYQVEREYYVNDLGHQADVLGRSIHLRYGELCGRTFSQPEDFYPGEYVVEVARELLAEHGPRYLDAPEAEWLPLFRDRGMERILARIRADLEAFGVTFDHWVSERELTARVGLSSIVEKLERAGHVYAGEGKKWFRTTSFADDKDRVVLREDGRPTYFASDIAYHDEKMSRGFQRLINVWGADHGGYVTRVKAGLAALGWKDDPLDVILVQMVSLVRGGEKVKMGKRLGTAVWLSDVVAEVGRDATRYFFAMRRSDAQLDFDVELATKKSLDNPVYYAQMGHARMCSIERKAATAGIPVPEPGPGALDALVLPEELGMIKALVRAPEVVAAAAVEHAPHQVVHYIQETIALFHSYYTQYKNSEKVISDDPHKTRARLLLCRALKTTLRALLGLLGVSAPERMALPAGETEEA
jgi:arginyl-tRNA synthetase